MALSDTRRALHAVAELVLAGPQYAANTKIRLRITPNGFATVLSPDVRVDGTAVVSGAARAEIDGRTAAELAAQLGLTARSARGCLPGGVGVGVDEPLTADPEFAAVIAAAFAAGETALRTFAPDEEPVLWPEHFDLGSTVDEVNYGVSSGDGYLDEPYAYVGPWTSHDRRTSGTPVRRGAPARPVPDPAAIVAFFEQGRAAAGR